MTQAEPNAIIHKKTRFGREGFDARSMSPAKALRLALAKSADMLFNLALSATDIEQSQISAQAVAKRLGDDGLLVLLDGAGGSYGAVKLDTPLLSGLIEAQITGEIRPGMVRPRRFTRTDAALAAPFLDAALRCFDDDLSSEDETHTPYALRFGDRIADARALGLALEGASYDMFRVRVDLGVGVRTGGLILLLPRRPKPDVAAQGPGAGKTAMTGSLARPALDASATLDAVLARLSLPLREICAFEPGTVLTLSPDVLSETELCAPGNHLVAAVRLGQMNGQRAVRLLAAGDGAALGVSEPEATGPASDAKPEPPQDPASLKAAAPAQDVLEPDAEPMPKPLPAAES